MGSKGSKEDIPQVPIAVGQERLLSKVEFQRLADVSPEAEWFANLSICTVFDGVSFAESDGEAVWLRK